MNQELAANTTLSHYRIVSKIGAGGIGEVYLAQDTRLDRKVAIKFLKEEFSRDADKLKRFTQEVSPLFQTQVSSYIAPNRFAVSADGQRFLVNSSWKKSARRSSQSCSTGPVS